MILAFRLLRKNYLYSTLNVAGLSFGLTAFIILAWYVSYELSYDSFHTEKDQVYRVESKFLQNGHVTDHLATASFGYGKAMQDECPEIIEFVRVNLYNAERVVQYEENIFREPNVISEAAAKKHFNREDPLHKMLKITNLSSSFECMVTGVFRDLPGQSNLQFDFLMSYMTAPQWQHDSWYMHESYLYVNVESPEKTRAVEEKFPSIAEKYKTRPALKEKVWAIELVPPDLHTPESTQNL